MNLRKNAKYLPQVLLIIVGSICWSLTMFKSGLIYSFGMGFWGPNGHDGIWHLSLINQLANFSLSHPTFAGESLTNYHFGFDFLAAIIHLLSRIPVHNLYFQILPPIFALLTGFLTYTFVNKWTSSAKKAWWAAFFVYFGGSWGWVLGKGESSFWANQAISTLINPPYALSLILLLGGMLLLLQFWEKPNLKRLIACSVVLGILIQVKVYAGIITLGSLGLVALFLLVSRNEKAFWALKLFFLTLAISLVVFLPFNLKAPSLLVLSPLWFPRTMIAFTDRVGWVRLENARTAYFASKLYLKWLAAEGLALAIFILGNLGTRIVGLVFLKEAAKNKKKDLIGLFVAFGAAISLIIPLVFIQKGNPWNTIQFFYYFQFFAAIFAGIVVGKIFESNLSLMLKAVCFIVLISLTVPTTVITLKDVYLPSRPPSRISLEELQALAFLKKQPKGVVLTYPFESEWRSKFGEPKPLYAYETTGYVSALSGKPVFLEDEMNLEISGYQWNTRRDEVLQFFLAGRQDFITGNKISYIYLVKGQSLVQEKENLNLEKIFENEEVKIYRTNE
jgi:hypothetical protein